MRAVLLIALVACATSSPQNTATEDWSVGPSGVEFTNQMMPSDLIWTGQRLMFAADRALLHPTGRAPMMVMLRAYTARGELVSERPVVEGMHAKLAFSGTGYGMAYTTQQPGGGDLRVNFARLDRNGALIDSVELGEAPEARVVWSPTRREYAVMWAHVSRPPPITWPVSPPVTPPLSSIEIARFSDTGDRLGRATLATTKGGVFAYAMISGLAAVGGRYVAIVQTPLTRILTDGTRLLDQRQISDGRDTLASLIADGDGSVVAYRDNFAMMVERATTGDPFRASPLQTAQYAISDPVVTGTVASPWLLYEARSRERHTHQKAFLVPLTANLTLGGAVAVDDPAIVDWMAVATPVPGGIAVGYQVGHFQQAQDVRVQVFATTSIAH